MNLGFVNVYAYRPHGHHAKFLSYIAKSAGHKSVSLDCLGAPSHCYVREYKGAGRSECVKCSLGGLHSFGFDASESVRKYWNSSLNGEADEVVRSSAYTLTRIESYEQRSSDEVNSIVSKLSGDAFRFYHAVRSWIVAQSLDAVILFNGRMDYTRAAMEACRDERVTCMTHERPLFGHGVILNRDANCSSLQNIHRINRKYKDKPLTSRQVDVAAALGAQRLIGGNPLEWKKYNENPVSAKDWPVTDVERKVLICPSSKNELLGHPDWETPWRDNTDALDHAVKHGVFSYQDLLIRFHPSWAVPFGVVTAEKCEQHYRSWCEARGVSFIPSDSKINTKDLIRQADVVVLNGSNTVLEAGMLGKPVVCFGSAPYTHSGAAIDVLSFSDIEQLNFVDIVSKDPREIVQNTLRYYYSKAAREPLFTDFVRSRTVTECAFYEGADSSLLDLILREGGEFEGDSEFADGTDYEKPVIDAFLNGDAAKLEKYASWQWKTKATEELRITRRGVFRLIDGIRRLTPKGV